MNNLNLYFNSVAATMDTVSQVMFRAAIVRTFTGIEGVDTVTFFADDSPLAGVGDTPLGAQSAADYVDLVGRGLSSTKKASMLLYYANQNGNALVTKQREIVYDSTFSLERDILARLAQGIPEEGCYPTLPSSVQVISINEKGGTCYLNFDGAFLTDALPVSGYVILYSIVNSLCELPDVKRVQIMVEGESSQMFKDNISLEAPFTSDLNY